MPILSLLLHRRLIFYRHALLLVRGRLLRWRLETFGIYAPSLPNQRPWWRVNRRALQLLVQHRREYSDWLQQMETVRSGGGARWWQRRLGSRYSTLQAYIQRENGVEPSPDDSAAD